MGAFAGRASLEGTGKIIETKTSNVIAEFGIDEKSSFGTGFAGTSLDVGKEGGARVGDHILKELEN